MAEDLYWLALVTFSRKDADQDILPDWAEGACGWMIALATGEDRARVLLTETLAEVGLRVLEIDEVRAVDGADEIEDVDKHLAANLLEIEPGARTVWGTLHCYVGEGEA